jgi:hypothetical protein
MRYHPRYGLQKQERMHVHPRMLLTGGSLGLQDVEK